MIKHLGSKYGGWFVDPDLVPVGSTVISAGVGTDTTFDGEIIELSNCYIVGIDPTEKARHYIEDYPTRNFRFINKALWSNNQPVKMYKNNGGDNVSESVCRTNKWSLDDWYMTDTITINELVATYPDISLLKMDIEGAEYEVIKGLKNMYISQIAVEFHHRYMTEYTAKDTEDAIDKIISFGYKMLVNDECGILFVRQV